MRKTNKLPPVNFSSVNYSDLSFTHRFHAADITRFVARANFKSQSGPVHRTTSFLVPRRRKVCCVPGEIRFVRYDRDVLRAICQHSCRVRSLGIPNNVLCCGRHVWWLAQGILHSDYFTMFLSFPLRSFRVHRVTIAVAMVTDLLMKQLAFHLLCILKAIIYFGQWKRLHSARDTKRTSSDLKMLLLNARSSAYDANKHNDAINIFLFPF